MDDPSPSRLPSKGSIKSGRSLKKCVEGDPNNDAFTIVRALMSIFLRVIDGCSDGSYGR